MNRHYVSDGEIFRLCLTYSEVCMFMRIAGQCRTVQFRERSHGGGVVYIYDADGRPYGPPVSPAEAGLGWDESRGRWYQLLLE